MGDVIAVAVVLLAVVIVIFRIVRRKKGNQIPSCCAGCPGCDLEKYGTLTDAGSCGADSELDSKMHCATCSKVSEGSPACETNDKGD